MNEENEEKILKGLECCKTIRPVCEKCPYNDTDVERMARALCEAAGRPDDDVDFLCLATLHADALWLIRRYEDEQSG